MKRLNARNPHHPNDEINKRTVNKKHGGRSMILELSRYFLLLDKNGPDQRDFLLDNDSVKKTVRSEFENNNDCACSQNDDIEIIETE